MKSPLRLRYRMKRTEALSLKRRGKFFGHYPRPQSHLESFPARIGRIRLWLDAQPRSCFRPSKNARGLAGRCGPIA
jgi:hypothetical protein